MSSIIVIVTIIIDTHTSLSNYPSPPAVVIFLQKISKTLYNNIMIISASRRTDIPAYYSEWFINRQRVGYALTRNPMNPRQVSKISLAPDVVDGIVFWTKNPEPMLDRLDEIKDIPYYFQFTLTSYGKDIETNVPSKAEHVIPTFKRLSDKISAERVIWRYDPIILNEKYTIDYHIKYFEKLAKDLTPYTNKCIISFLDFYRCMKKVADELQLININNEQRHILAKALSEIAKSNNLELCTCAESLDFTSYGISPSRCVDKRIFEKITGVSFDTKKDKNQRAECGCDASIDIGMYNTCLNGCRYCYANHSDSTIKRNFESHSPNSPLLCGYLGEDDVVKARKMVSERISQVGFDTI